MCVNLCVYVVFAAFTGEIKIYITYNMLNFSNNFYAGLTVDVRRVT